MQKKNENKPIIKSAIANDLLMLYFQLNVLLLHKLKTNKIKIHVKNRIN